jgi:hypothetical protein
VEAQASGASRRPLGALVQTVDREIRALHGRFVTERDGIVVLLARATELRRALAVMPPPAAPVHRARRTRLASSSIRAPGRRRR